MRKFQLLLLLVSAATISCAQSSPRQQAEGKVGGATVTIDYGAPSVKGRTVWGGLEHYDKVWRAGANENTTVTFDKGVTIGGKALPAGKYGFFIIPKENGAWTVIFNKKNDAWGAFSYNEAEDALRVDATPSFVDQVQEQLMYSVDGGAIKFAWDKTRLSIAVK